MLTAIVLTGIPLDAVVPELGSSRNAVYKMMFDARPAQTQRVLCPHRVQDTLAG